MLIYKNISPLKKREELTNVKEDFIQNYTFVSTNVN